MKEHILSRGSEFIPLISSIERHYDFESQVNYVEEKFENKLIHEYGPKGQTIVTEAVEMNDPDNILGFVPNRHLFNEPTKLTYTVENTDTDN